jgi:hypothetical protein
MSLTIAGVPARRTDRSIIGVVAANQSRACQLLKNSMLDAAQVNEFTGRL